MHDSAGYSRRAVRRYGKNARGMAYASLHAPSRVQRSAEKKVKIIKNKTTERSQQKDMTDIFELFKQIEKKEDAAPAGEAISWIIAGLGNPGREYEITRHNAGFLCMDVLSDRMGTRVDRAKFNALTGEATISGKKVLLMKPMTMMNLSGDAVREAAAFYKIRPDHIIIIVDDTNLPVGHLRIRTHGSAGGHNGLKSLISQLGTDAFLRLRIGVGAKPHPDMDIADWVLSRFNAEDRAALLPAFEVATDGCELLVGGELDRAQQLCNTHS